MPKTKQQKSDKAALDAANNHANATPVGKRPASATPPGSAANKRIRKQSKQKTPPFKKKQNKGSPSSGGNNASTPSSVASNVKWLTPEKQKKLKGVKKQENKLTEVEEIETTALATIQANSTATSLKVHNSMWPFASECELADDEEEIFFYRNQVNHNAIGPAIANEITNNFLNNPINADLTGKVHTRNMGGDMNCLLAWNKKVNACSEIFTFCKKKTKFPTSYQTRT